MGLTTEQRQKIVDQAKDWCKDTPYRGNTAIKNVGADCGMLLFGVMRDSGFIPADVEAELPHNYPMNLAQHKADDTYINTIRKFAREIPEAEVLPGDIVVYKIGKGWSHGAIIVSWPEHIVHALIREGVHAAHGKTWKLNRRYERMFLTLRDEFCQQKEAA
jgi:hypothetical protein